MDPAAAPLFMCSSMKKRPYTVARFLQELWCTRAAGVVGGLPMPSLVESLTTSCREGGDGSGVVQRRGIVQSH